MKIHPVSLAVPRVKLFFHDIPLGHATCFIYNGGQDISVVSNWHVFSGRHPVTGLPLHHTGCVPNRIETHLSIATRLKGGIQIEFREIKLNLIDKDKKALWWQHRGYEDDAGKAQHIDIGVMPLSPQIVDLANFKKNIQSFDQMVMVDIGDGSEGSMTYQQGYVRIGAEVFIIGYPEGLALQGPVPVWKRGSIASEPLYGIEGNIPVVLVDALTRHGMSGSPVISFEGDLTDLNGVPIGSMKLSEPWLVGVYAGRRGSTENELSMALGRVWKKELLDTIFFQKIAGGTPASI